MQQQQQQQQPPAPQPPPPAADSSPEDSDIEEGGQDSAAAVAALLAEAQAAVQRRRAAAALTIQCAFRRHRAQAVLQQLREQRLAADRLVARALAAAYRGVCGSRRTLAGQAARRQLRRLRRFRVQQRQRLRKRARAAEVDETAADATELPQHQEAPLDAATAPKQQADPSALEVQPSPFPACAAYQIHDPPAAAQPAAAERPSGGRRVGTPPAVFITAPGPPPPAFLPATRPCTGSSGGSSRGGSPAQQQQQQPWQARQASPLAHARSSSSGGGPGQGCPPSPLQQGVSPPRTASGLHSSGSSCRKELYRRSSSIQLLEAVQLGIDGAGGSVASQAALGVCERAQQRVQELQCCASQGRPCTAGGGSVGGHRIGRVASARAARQGSGQGWAAEAIPE